MDNTIRFWDLTKGERTVPLTAGEPVIEGSSVRTNVAYITPHPTECPHTMLALTIDVLKDTYDHSCDRARSDECQHLMTGSPAARSR